MKSVSCLIIVLLVFSSSFASEKIIDLIKRGDVDQARREIERYSTASRREGDLLYFQALLESDGSKSRRFLEAAFKAELSPQYLPDNVYLEALYYLADGDYERLAATANAYLQYWEAGKYRPHMIRLEGLGLYRQEKREEFERNIERLIAENSGRLFGQLGRLDRARHLYKSGNYAKADRICRDLSKSEFDEIAAPALYLLSDYAFEQRRTDDAILYFNLLKEAYPYAVGLDDLMDRFTGLEKKSDDLTAEKMTGTVYSVQVGVFSVKQNAENLAERMKAYGKKVEIKDKKISEKNYYVVYVGRFLSSDDAMAFKARLEISEEEIFQVVAR